MNCATTIDDIKDFVIFTLLGLLNTQKDNFGVEVYLVKVLCIAYKIDPNYVIYHKNQMGNRIISLGTCDLAEYNIEKKYLKRL